jgi:hypothetical protein
MSESNGKPQLGLNLDVVTSSCHCEAKAKRRAVVNHMATEFSP